MTDSRTAELRAIMRIMEWHAARLQHYLSANSVLPRYIDVYSVLSHGREGQQTRECQERVVYAAQRLMIWKSLQPESAWPILQINAPADEWEYMYRWAQETFYPADRIEVLNRTPFPECNTMTQMKDLNAWALERGCRYLVVGTSRYHCPRVELTAKRWLAPELFCDLHIDPLGWEEQLEMKEVLALYSHEAASSARYARGGYVAYPWDGQSEG